MNSSSIVPRIAIIGTEGSGKTVLITTLAHRLSRVSAEGVFLNPRDTKTHRYVEETWNILTSGEWPKGTDAGQLFELRWRLQCGGMPNVECDLQLVDAAGQDLRRLFQGDADDDLPEHLRQLAEYCRASDLAIYLINLKDFLGESDLQRRIENEIVIKSAIDRLCRDESRRTLLLLTQIDQFTETLKRYHSAPEVVRDYLPYVYGAHVATGRVPVSTLAAVYDTRVVESDGLPRRVPAPNFRSKGIDELMAWLVEEIREITAEGGGRQVFYEQKADAVETNQRDAQVANESRQDDLREYGGLAKPFIAVVYLIIVAVGAVWYFWGGSSEYKLEFGKNWGIVYGSFFDQNEDIWLLNSSSVTMHDIKFVVEVVENGKFVRRLELSSSEPLMPGRKINWRDVIDIAANSGSASKARLRCREFP